MAAEVKRMAQARANRRGGKGRMTVSVDEEWKY
jgi:hypothetical protein